MRVVCEAHARGDCDVVGDRREPRDVAVRLDPHAVAQHATALDDGVGPDVTVVSDGRVFADEDVSASLEPVADPDSPVDRGTGADPAVLSDLDRTRLRAAGFGAQSDVLVDQRSLADVYVLERTVASLRNRSRLRQHRAHVIASIVSPH